MPKQSRCARHDGMTIYFTENSSKCQVCAKDEMIAHLDLEIRFQSCCLRWGLDWVRILNYGAIDKADRERIIEGVKDELDKSSGDLKKMVEVLEKYDKTRKSFSWSKPIGRMLSEN